MIFASAVLALLAGAVAAAPSQATKRDWCGLHDCSLYQLYTVDTLSIDNPVDGMIIGNSQTTPAELPSTLHGLWYMDGNPLADEVVSFAGIKYHPEDKSFTLKVYDERIWSWDGGNEEMQGSLLYSAVRFFGLTYKLTFNEDQTVGQVIPLIYPPVPGLSFPIGEMLANFTLIYVEDGYWIRRTSFLQKDVPDYKFQRIVEGNGTRAANWNNFYVPNIDSKARGITLTTQQQLARKIF